MNHIDGVVKDGGLDTSFGVIPVDGFGNGRSVRMLIRPEGLKLRNSKTGSNGTPVDAVSAHLLGDSSIVHCRLREGPNTGMEFQVRIAGAFDPAAMGQIRAEVDPRLTFVYPEDKQ